MLLLALLLAACAAPEPPPVVAPDPVAAPEPPAPPVIQTEPVAPPAPPPPMLHFAGHIASFKAMAEAERGWAALARRHSVLQGLTPRYVEVDLGGSRGKVVRVLLGGFVDRDGARAYCFDMRREGLFCAPHPLPEPLPATK